MIRAKRMLYFFISWMDTNRVKATDVKTIRLVHNELALRRATNGHQVLFWWHRNPLNMYSILCVIYNFMDFSISSCSAVRNKTLKWTDLFWHFYDYWLILGRTFATVRSAYNPWTSCKTLITVPNHFFRYAVSRKLFPWKSSSSYRILMVPCFMYAE